VSGCCLPFASREVAWWALMEGVDSRTDFSDAGPRKAQKEILGSWAFISEPRSDSDWFYAGPKAGTATRGRKSKKQKTNRIFTGFSELLPSGHRE
jgi:hypothetical protein